MSAERLDAVVLQPGEALPLDRAYAIENGSTRFDPAAPRHLPKICFLMLMRDERLAALEARLDEATHVLTLSRGGRQVARGDLTTPLGRKMIEQFIAAFMQGSLRGAPRIVAAPGHTFGDAALKCVHIVSRKSLQELERVHGRAIDVVRFRPNLVIDDAPAWAERWWVDRKIKIGEAELEIIERTERCAAIDVDPSTAVRDAALGAVLRRARDQTDFGVYAVVTRGGRIAAGDAAETT